jgi:NADP-dependent 3-hydroxy acid dehydrogenase YdfG
VWLITGASSGLVARSPKPHWRRGRGGRRAGLTRSLTRRVEPDRVTALQLDVTDQDRIAAAVGEVLTGTVASTSWSTTPVAARRRRREIHRQRAA